MLINVLASTIACSQQHNGSQIFHANFNSKFKLSCPWETDTKIDTKNERVKKNNWNVTISLRLISATNRHTNVTRYWDEFYYYGCCCICIFGKLQIKGKISNSKIPRNRICRCTYQSISFANIFLVHNHLSLDNNKDNSTFDVILYSKKIMDKIHKRNTWLITEHAHAHMCLVVNRVISLCSNFILFICNCTYFTPWYLGDINRESDRSPRFANRSHGNKGIRRLAPMC